jgi:hypothetical protein
MSKNNLNLNKCCENFNNCDCNNNKYNNRYNNICNLPPLMSDGRLFTNYMSHSLYEYNNKNKIVNCLNNDNCSMIDSHTYRNILQKESIKIINNELSFYNKYKCNNKNFNIDLSNFNKNKKKYGKYYKYNVYYNEHLNKNEIISNNKIE